MNNLGKVALLDRTVSISEEHAHLDVHFVFIQDEPSFLSSFYELHVVFLENG
jgi:hypothetical protein